MKRIAIIFALLLPIAASWAGAQTDTFSNKILVSFETQKADWVNLRGLSTTKGISAAYMRNYVFGGKAGLAIEYGAKMTWLHGVDKSNWTTSREDHLNISLPVNITKEFGIGNSGVSLAPFIGPNFKYNIIGKYHKTWFDNDGKNDRWTNYLSREERQPASIFQFGMNIGVCAYYGRFVVAYTFQPDFTSYVKDHDYYCDHTNTSSVSVGFRF